MRTPILILAEKQVLEALRLTGEAQTALEALSKNKLTGQAAAPARASARHCRRIAKRLSLTLVELRAAAEKIAPAHRSDLTKALPRYQVRMTLEKLTDGEPLHFASREDTIQLARRLIGDSDRERMIVLLLNGKNRLVGWEEVAVGGPSMVACPPSQLLRSAVLCGARGLIVIHNHPSGEACLSSKDQAFCSTSARAAEVLGIDLLDMIVVTPLGEWAAADGSAG